MSTVTDDTLALGRTALLQDQHTLVGPFGSVRLIPRQAAVLARLMRRPGVVVHHDTLMSALYPDPDLEPENSARVLLMVLSQLRGALEAVARSSVTLRNERGEGWFVEERK